MKFYLRLKQRRLKVGDGLKMMMFQIVQIVPKVSMFEFERYDYI